MCLTNYIIILNLLTLVLKIHLMILRLTFYPLPLNTFNKSNFYILYGVKMF